MCLFCVQDFCQTRSLWYNLNWSSSWTVWNRIEAFGGPKDVGEVVLRRIARTRKSPDINATLIDAALREDAENVKYYKLEFRVESPSFRRHNVAVCCARNGKLYTMNAQAPESAWKDVQREFAAMADSFSLVVDAWWCSRYNFVPLLPFLE